MTEKQQKLIDSQDPFKIYGGSNRAIDANADTPPAPLNQSRDVRQGTIPPPSTLQYSNQALHNNISRYKKDNLYECLMRSEFNDWDFGGQRVDKQYQSRYPKDALLRIMER